jgi:tRNA(Arg) A34 adenosine deaminase TadA
MPSLFQSEKDALAFLGLMSAAYQRFDYQFKHNDGEPTHVKGLNIFAAIVDNTDGELLGHQQNQIHLENNPMLHAEQLTLKAAIERINKKRPRNNSTTSTENYYRNYLFNDPASKDFLNNGCTIYTTLEPCPFCTSALLVNRMKRIVFIIPDKKFGSAYSTLKNTFYSTYDMYYEQMTITPYPKSALTQFAADQYKILLNEIEKLKQANPKLYDTLLLDYLNPLLKACHEYFINLSEKDLVTADAEREKNTSMLKAFQQSK